MMKVKALVLAAIGSLSLITISCDKAKDAADKAAGMDLSNLSVESIPDKASDLLKDLPDTLLTIKDDASFDAAKEKIEGMTGGIDKLAAAAKALPKPSNEVRKGLGDKVGEKLDSVLGSKMGEAKKHLDGLRETNPELAAKVDALKDKFQESMGKLLDLFSGDGPLAPDAE